MAHPHRGAEQRGWYVSTLQLRLSFCRFYSLLVEVSKTLCFSQLPPSAQCLMVLGCSLPTLQSGCQHIPPSPLSWQGDLPPCCLPSAEPWSSSFPDLCCEALTSTGPCFWETTACSLALRHTAKALIMFVCFLGLEGLPRPFPISCYF